MTAYYNEIDRDKAAWLRELIKRGLIAPGDVDERSIVDVRGDELRGYVQCHFFAGIGVWGYALRQAGWPDDRPVWTGSCPCPSFSAAGKGAGFADPRHLWPEWARLIRECRPGTIFGEQVAAAIGHGWLDLVCGDVEEEGYAVAAAVLGAHSVGAPHIRQRLYFVAESASQRHDRGGAGEAGSGEETPIGSLAIVKPERPRDAGLLVQPIGAGLEGLSGDGRDGHEPGRDGAQPAGPVASTGDPCGMGDSAKRGFGIDGSASGEGGHIAQPDGAFRPSPLNGFWRDADWIGCRDGKWRPVEPGTFPLAHGSAARVGRLRMYGDAICVPAAQEFIEAAMMAIEDQKK